MVKLPEKKCAEASKERRVEVAEKRRQHEHEREGNMKAEKAT